MCTLVNESERKKKRPGSSDMEALWVIKIGDCKGLVINGSKGRLIFYSVFSNFWWFASNKSMSQIGVPSLNQ